MLFGVKRNKVSGLAIGFLLILLLGLEGFAGKEKAAELFRPPSSRVDRIQKGTNGKTIFLIQSAHVQLEAQKAVRDILKYLVEKKSLYLLLVEGGWGDVSLAQFRHHADRERRLEVAERYLKEGKISAEEYLDLTEDYDWIIWGIENPDEYRTNMEAFLDFYEVQENLLSELEKLERSLKSIEEGFFPPSVVDFLSRKRDFENGNISLFDYLSFLNKYSEAKIKNAPHLKKLVSVMEESEFDSAKVELEKKNLMKALFSSVTKLELEPFKLIEGPRSLGNERAYLKSLIEAHREFKSRLPNVSIEEIKKCSNAFEFLEADDPKNVFEELWRLENSLLEEAALAEKEKQLVELIRFVSLLKKLFQLELNSGDYGRIQAFIPFGLRETFESFSNSDPVHFELIETWIPKAISFYEAAVKRERALIENGIMKIEETKEKEVGLLVGGFHSERLADEFHKLGFTVITISPRFVVSDRDQSDKHYFEMLKYKWGQGKAVASNLSLS